MVRYIVRKVLEKDVVYYESAGLSTDTKPYGDVATGSSFIEVNTGKVYFYDESTNSWIEAGGGSE